MHTVRQSRHCSGGGTKDVQGGVQEGTKYGTNVRKKELNLSDSFKIEELDYKPSPIEIEYIKYVNALQKCVFKYLNATKYLNDFKD